MCTYMYRRHGRMADTNNISRRFDEAARIAPSLPRNRVLRRVVALLLPLTSPAIDSRDRTRTPGPSDRAERNADRWHDLRAARERNVARPGPRGRDSADTSSSERASTVARAWVVPGAARARRWGCGGRVTGGNCLYPGGLGRLADGHLATGQL